MNELLKTQIADAAERLKTAEKLADEEITRLVKENKDSAIQEVSEWLHEKIGKITYGEYSSEVRPCSYDDCISEETLAELWNEYQYDNSGFEFFSDFFDERQGEEWGWWSVWEQEDRLLDEVRKELAEESTEFKEIFDRITKNLDTFEILELGGYSRCDIDYANFLQANYRFNFLLATKEELNQDLYSIPPLACGLIDENRLEEKHLDNALTYLMHQQGEKLSDLFKPNSENKFVQSVMDERDSIYSDYTVQVVALASFSGRDVLDVLDAISYNEGNKYIKFPQNATIGLYNSNSGCGGNLEITLQKPLIVPTNLVSCVEAEGKRNGHYTLDSVYGLCGECWTEGAELTDEPAVLIDEDFSEIKQAYTEYRKCLSSDEPTVAEAVRKEYAV